MITSRKPIRPRQELGCPDCSRRSQTAAARIGPNNRGLNCARGPLARPATLTTTHASRHPTGTKEESSALRAVKGELHRHRSMQYRRLRGLVKANPAGSQGNRTSKSLDRRIGACPIRAWSTLPIGVQNARWESALDQFVRLLGGVGGPADWQCHLHRLPRNAGDRPVHCACQAVVKALDGDGGVRRWPRSRSCASFLKLEHGLPSHDTFSRLFRHRSIPSSSAIASSASWAGLPMPAKASSRLMARCCAAPSIRPAEVGAAHGPRLGQRCEAGAGTVRYRCQVERDHCGAKATGNALVEGNHRHG